MSILHESTVAKAREHNWRNNYHFFIPPPLEWKYNTILCGNADFYTCKLHPHCMSNIICPQSNGTIYNYHHEHNSWQKYWSDLPLISPRNLAMTNLSRGLMFIFLSSLVRCIPSSSHREGKFSSTSPTTCKYKIIVRHDAC